MAIRKMSLTQWAESLELHRAKPSFKRFQGSSPGGAAERLGYTRQRIHQFIKEGKLDLVLLHQDDDAGKKPCVWIVTDQSIERFLKSKPMEQEDLRFSKG